MTETTAEGPSLSSGYDTEIVVFLGLGAVPGVGFRSLRRVGGRLGLRRLMESKNPRSVGIATDLAWEDFRQRVWSEGRRLAQSLNEKGVTFAFEGDPLYPVKLGDIEESKRPAWIFLRGNVALLAHPTVAVVGTRSPSPEGLFLAQYAVTVVRSLDSQVLSGLAKGIDGVAHEWSLRRGCPTISVLGTGILRPYPSSHADLGERIVSHGGLLISEYLPFDEPRKERFIERNRVQAALSDVVVAAEWTRRSGTAHTVRYAREMNRPVFGLAVEGGESAPDAGSADIDFNIPTDATAFRQALLEALDASAHKERAVQDSLFEGR